MKTIKLENRIYPAPELLEMAARAIAVRAPDADMRYVFADGTTETVDSATWRNSLAEQRAKQQMLHMLDAKELTPRDSFGLKCHDDQDAYFVLKTRGFDRADAERFLLECEINVCRYEKTEPPSEPAAPAGTPERAEAPAPVATHADDDAELAALSNETAAHSGEPGKSVSTKPWLMADPRDPKPKQPWYVPARYFARELIKGDSTLLVKRPILAGKVAQSLTNAGFYKRGGKKPLRSSTVLNAFSGISLG